MACKSIKYAICKYISKHAVNFFCVEKDTVSGHYCINERLCIISIILHYFSFNIRYHDKLIVFQKIIKNMKNIQMRETAAVTSKQQQTICWSYTCISSFLLTFFYFSLLHYSFYKKKSFSPFTVNNFYCPQGGFRDVSKFWKLHRLNKFYKNKHSSLNSALINLLRIIMINPIIRTV